MALASAAASGSTGIVTSTVLSILALLELNIAIPAGGCICAGAKTSPEPPLDAV